MGSLFTTSALWLSLAAPSPHSPPHSELRVQVHAAQGDIDIALVKSTCRAIQNNFSLPCAYTIVPPPASWTDSEDRIDAAAFLDAQFSLSTSQTDPQHAQHNGGQIDLWLTSKDLYEGARPFVFGIMSMTDRIGIVSMHRIEDPKRPRVTAARLHKVVIHELAHALDLGHHDLDSCVMQVEPDLAHLDHGASSLCGACRARVERTMARLQRKGQFLWDRAIGHKVRGQMRQAQRLLLPLMRSQHVHPELQDQAQRLWSRLLTK